jgi:hypothetical protein
VTAIGHHYSVQTVQKAVQQTIDSGSSLRGVEKNLKLEVSEEEETTPSFSSVRNWLGRIGLYELQREKEYRNDWVFIIDLTVELGKQKCLVILGVSQQYLESAVFPSKFKLAATSDLEIFKQKLIMKFGWLKDYLEVIRLWSQMVMMTRTLETQLKQNGINQESLAEFELKNNSTFLHITFPQNIGEYIKTEIEQIPKGKTFLATSDIIESIFGKYKHFSSRCPLKQIGQMILSISLCTMNLATSVVKQALENVSYIGLAD